MCVWRCYASVICQVPMILSVATVLRAAPLSGNDIAFSCGPQRTTGDALESHMVIGSTFGDPRLSNLIKYAMRVPTFHQKVQPSRVPTHLGLFVARTVLG